MARILGARVDDVRVLVVDELDYLDAAARAVGRQFLTMSKIWITISKTINCDNDVQT